MNTVLRFYGLSSDDCIHVFTDHVDIDHAGWTCITMNNCNVARIAMCPNTAQQSVHSLQKIPLSTPDCKHGEANFWQPVCSSRTPPCRAEIKVPLREDDPVSCLPLHLCDRKPVERIPSWTISQRERRPCNSRQSNHDPRASTRALAFRGAVAAS